MAARLPCFMCRNMGRCELHSGRRRACCGLQVGGDGLLKALAAAEHNAPDAAASAPVLEGCTRAIRCAAASYTLERLVHESTEVRSHVTKGP